MLYLGKKTRFHNYFYIAFDPRFTEGYLKKSKKFQIIKFILVDGLKTCCRVARAGATRSRPFWLEPEPFFWSCKYFIFAGP